MKPFDIEFQPFIEEINVKEGVIREYADAATMERIKSTILFSIGQNGVKSNANTQILELPFRVLR